MPRLFNRFFFFFFFFAVDVAVINWTRRFFFVRSSTTSCNCSAKFSRWAEETKPNNVIRDISASWSPIFFYIVNPFNEERDVNSTMTIQTKENDPLIYVDTNAEGCINVFVERLFRIMISQTGSLYKFDSIEKEIQNRDESNIRLNLIVTSLQFPFIFIWWIIFDRSWIASLMNVFDQRLLQGQGTVLSRKKVKNYFSVRQNCHVRWSICSINVRRSMRFE